MSEEETSKPENTGCLALFVSVTLAALLLTPTVFPPAFTTWEIYFLVFGVTGMITALIGLPLYLVVARYERKNIWTALGAGALTGAALPLIGVLLDGRAQQWLNVADFAAIGAIGGLAFYLTATAPRLASRQVALLLVLAGAATGIAVIAGAAG